MPVLVKDGVIFKEFKREVLKIIEVLHIASERFGKDMVITSANDGLHKDGSLHYKNLAIDIRTIHLTKSQKDELVKFLSEKLGADYDVIFEVNPEHIHIEYDPKNK